MPAEGGHEGEAFGPSRWGFGGDAAGVWEGGRFLAEPEGPEEGAEGCGFGFEEGRHEEGEAAGGDAGGFAERAELVGHFLAGEDA